MKIGKVQSAWSKAGIEQRRGSGRAFAGASRPGRKFTTEARRPPRKEFYQSNSELRDLCASAVNISASFLVAAVPRCDLRASLMSPAIHFSLRLRAAEIHC
jgi:hypothetical protein